MLQRLHGQCSSSEELSLESGFHHVNLSPHHPLPRYFCPAVSPSLSLQEFMVDLLPPREGIPPRNIYNAPNRWQKPRPPRLRRSYPIPRLALGLHHSRHHRRSNVRLNLPLRPRDMLGSYSPCPRSSTQISVKFTYPTKVKGIGFKL